MLSRPYLHSASAHARAEIRKLYVSKAGQLIGNETDNVKWDLIEIRPNSAPSVHRH